MRTLTQPSRLTFWRIILGIMPLTAFAAFYQLWNLAEKLNVVPLTSKSWLTGLGTLVLVGVFGLGLFVSTWSARREMVLDALEASAKISEPLRWMVLPALLIALLGSTFILFHNYYGDLLRNQDWVRLFIFFLLALLGMNALKLLWPTLSWPTAFLVTVLFQTMVYRIALYLPDISDYPFAMGWSETSRFYWPSLFISPSLYGQRVPWPILHPSLHLALLPPYLFDAPLWFHRFWQVTVRFLLVGLIAPALLYRLKLENRALRWLFGVWVFVYLFALPLYLHLAVPVFIMLWGFSPMNNRRTWLALIVASIWAGLSRLNWYPMPGILAAVLFALEVPDFSREPGNDNAVNAIYRQRYVLKPFLWFVSGTILAFVTQRIYIVFSGIPDAGNFYTSLSSSLLVDRLLPNPSYPLGIIPGILIFSLPLLLIWLNWPFRYYWVREQMITLAIFVLFVGGIFVSLKIGGGADLHNMDAYAVLLMIVASYMFFGRIAPESTLPKFHWSTIALLVLVPAWLILQGKSSVWAYNSEQAQTTLAALQQRVDLAQAEGGEVLFITQRHLIAMHMLHDVKLIPEYEREELMEMAMASNETYLDEFRAQLRMHRFAAIVVDPLTINFVGESEAMGAENDAWTRYVAKRILCTYHQAQIFPADRTAIYLPQEGDGQCPGP